MRIDISVVGRCRTSLFLKSRTQLIFSQAPCCIACEAAAQACRSSSSAALADFFRRNNSSFVHCERLVSRVMSLRKADGYTNNMISEYALHLI